MEKSNYIVLVVWPKIENWLIHKTSLIQVCQKDSQYCLLHSNVFMIIAKHRKVNISRKVTQIQVQLKHLKQVWKEKLFHQVWLILWVQKVQKQVMVKEDVVSVRNTKYQQVFNT